LKLGLVFCSQQHGCLRRRGNSTPLRLYQFPSPQYDRRGTAQWGGVAQTGAFQFERLASPSGRKTLSSG
jgi:hypothetical protein